MQANLHPKEMEKICKQMQKDLDKGLLQEIKWGRPITVEEVDGIFVEQS